jgi:predicted Zn-dependent peptidase
LFSKIEAVTAEDIKRAAEKIIRDEKLNLAVIGPHKNDEEIRDYLTFKNK